MKRTGVALLFVAGIIVVFVANAYRRSTADMPTWLILLGLLIAGSLIAYDIVSRKRKREKN